MDIQKEWFERRNKPGLDEDIELYLEGRENVFSSQDMLTINKLKKEFEDELSALVSF